MDEIETLSDATLVALRAAHRSLSRLRTAPYDFGPQRGLELLRTLDQLRDLTAAIEALCADLAANAEPIAPTWLVFYPYRRN